MSQAVIFVALAVVGIATGCPACGKAALPQYLPAPCGYPAPLAYAPAPLAYAAAPLAYAQAPLPPPVPTLYAAPPAPEAPLCLPPLNPYEALQAALALPGPAAAPLALPPQAPLGPILPGCGPAPSPTQIIQAPSVTVPGPCSPVIELPAPCAPAPQILAHKCVVSKAVLKPQVYQRLLHVPSVARFLKKSYTPVVENIAYTATPKCGAEAPAAILPAALPAGLPAGYPAGLPAGYPAGLPAGLLGALFNPCAAPKPCACS